MLAQWRPRALLPEPVALELELAWAYKASAPAPAQVLPPALELALTALLASALQPTLGVEQFQKPAPAARLCSLNFC